MTPKRNGQDSEALTKPDNTPVVMQAMRAAEEVGAAKQEKKDEEKISLFWRVFGGTILSIVALVAVTLYNNISSAINELRAEVNRANEARAELIRKDEFNTRMTSQWDRVQGMQAQNNSQNATITSLRTEIDALKDRLNRQGMESDGVRKDAQATAEMIKKDLAGLEVLKERLVALSTDLKATREDLQKTRLEVDKNQAYDLERKTLRDIQFKQFDETIKELTKGLSDCREKLARIEGQIFVGPPSPRPATPTVPMNEK